ncbi:hypothetical protein BN1110_05703 [bacterium YEK0313]|nr:hypothetical protein BN1110_05703 [bacterium YEK0313]
MKLRALYGRSRRGRGIGLKTGRSRLRTMSIDQFDAILSKYSRIDSFENRHHVKNLRRLLRKLRRDETLIIKPIVIKRRMKSDGVLDTIYPERNELWIPSWKRKKTGSLDLHRFSFIDNPIQTISLLRDIVERESTWKAYSLNFIDNNCLDISAYMVLGLLREKMLPVITGGKITAGIRRVVSAVNLSEFLNIKGNGPRRVYGIYPFTLRQRRGAGESVRDNNGKFVTSEERTASLLPETIDKWLSELNPPLALSERGRINILTLIGEVLDNAKRHSDPANADGTWSIAGFMEARERSDGSTTLACHLGIINPGHTIYQSLQRAPADIRAQVSKYATSHTSGLFQRCPYDEEALWTVSALQDTISRVPLSEKGSRGGFGMMTLVEMINELNQSPHPEDRPRMTIVSGTSCVMVRDKHEKFRKIEAGHRIMAFNDGNVLDQPPDGEYVFTLPYRFQGTIVALRFFLDPSERKKDGQE